jgi:uncharacterized protein (TIGR02145 family)
MNKLITSMLLVLIAGTITAQTVKNVYRSDGPTVRIPIHLIDTVTTVFTNDGEMLSVLQTNGHTTQVSLAVIDSIIHREGSALDPSQLGPLNTTSVMGTVVDENGEAVVDAVVQAGYGVEQTTTDINGVFFLDSIAVYERLGFIKVEKQGFFTGTRSFIPSAEGQRSLLKVELSPRLLIGNFSSGSGGSATAGSFNVSFVPNSIVQNGQPYSGQVNVYAAVFDPTEPTFSDRMPGDLIGGMNDTLQMLLSFGMVDVEITDSNGQPVQIAEGNTAELTYSIPTEMQNDAPNQIAFWSFDNQAGYWLYEGEAVRVGNNYVGQANHFSSWNLDHPTSAPVTLSVTCKDDEARPITGGAIWTNGQTWGTPTAYTDLTGTASIRVRPNEAYDIDLKMYCPITEQWDVVNTITTSPIAPGSVGNENMSGQLPGQYPVTGTVLKCNGDLVKTGYVISTAGGDVHFLEDGTFNFNVCQTGPISIRAYDTSTDSLKASELIELTVDATGVEVGSVTTCFNVGHVTDLDGNVYQTAAIGVQVWMVENLRATAYANGDPIPLITHNAQWGGLTTGAWVYYNEWANFSDSSQIDNLYGKLYNWYAVADQRNVCPSGWHVPSNSDWNTLIGYLDPSFNPSALSQSTTAGGKMKSTGIWQNSNGLWSSPNLAATNESGFSAHPGGYRSSTGGYYSLRQFGHWWSTEEHSTEPLYALCRRLSHDWGDVEKTTSDKNAGYSVRCLQD